MRFLDLTSWQGILLAIFGVALIALIGVGIRVLMMLTIQQRQQRMNRQINERLRTLIAACRVLGGFFTGELTVDPSHLRDLQRQAREQGEAAQEPSKRPRRIRDAVEAAQGAAGQAWEWAPAWGAQATPPDVSPRPQPPSPTRPG